jgi:hypothetical protein
MSYDTDQEENPDEVQAAMSFKMVDNAKNFVRRLLDEHDLVRPIAEDAVHDKLRESATQQRLADDLFVYIRNSEEFRTAVKEVVKNQMNKY